MVEFMATLSTQIGFDDLSDACAAYGLRIAGVCDVRGNDSLPNLASLVLLAPSEPGFWEVFAHSDEYNDGFEHPMDRWSARVIGNLGTEFGGTAYFPFGGAPYHPFYSWALSTGRVYASPLRFLVDNESGLYVSFRGAIGFTQNISDPRPVLSTPCAGCAAPCLTSCPADALDETDYNVPKCKSYLMNAIESCETFGCAARRACPYTAKTQRPVAHAKFHMRAFMGA
jgi:hypothetical protein